jgi:hypothetical protein
MFPKIKISLEGCHFESLRDLQRNETIALKRLPENDFQPHEILNTTELSDVVNVIIVLETKRIKPWVIIVMKPHHYNDFIISQL